VEAVVDETATQQQVDNMCRHFQQLCGAFVKVLRGYPGLRVSSFSWNDEPAKICLQRLIWSNEMSSSTNWMPPVVTWEWFQRLVREQGRTCTIEADWQGL
jgi:hypothetical protein